MSVEWSGFHELGQDLIATICATGNELFASIQAGNFLTN